MVNSPETSPYRPRRFIPILAAIAAQALFPPAAFPARKAQAMFVRIQGDVIVLRGCETYKAQVRDGLLINDKVITGPFRYFGNETRNKGYALIKIPGGELRLGPKTCIVIGDMWARAEQEAWKKASFWQKTGILLQRTHKWIQTFRGDFDIGEPHGGCPCADYVDHEATIFTISTQQRIAYVNGSDLWLMNDDGSGATNFISAPVGGRIGRSAFARDGSMVVYEVMYGSIAVPERCDLYIAGGDGSNPRLLLNAGSLGDATGIPGTSYSMRLLAGPSFSPDGTRVSFMRIQDFWVPATYARVRQKDLCTIPVSGGSPSVLWTTREIPGGYVDYDVGANTQWLDNNDIGFVRSGKMGARISGWVDATDANRSSWMADFYVEWDSEAGYSPQRLDLAVGSANAGTAGPLRGYGILTPTAAGFDFTEWPLSSGWQTPQMGAWYGPLHVSVTAGMCNAVVTASDGITPLTAVGGVIVTKGAKGPICNASGNYYAESAEGGVWVLPAGGGRPRQALRAVADSFAWNPDGSRLLIEYEDYGSVNATYLILYDNNGQCLDYGLLGQGTESGIGNWDDTGTRAVAWCGRNGTNTIYLLDEYSSEGIAIAQGRYPMFTPLHRTEVVCYEDWVSVRNTNTDHKVIAQAGQQVVDDDLLNKGYPQGPALVAAPRVAAVAPAPGSAVPTSAPVRVTFQFTAPVQTNSVLSNWISGVTWPAADGDQSGFMLEATAYALRMADTNGGSSFGGTLKDLLNAGILSASWDAGATSLTLTAAADALVRSPGWWGEIRLELAGTRGTNGAIHGFADAMTLLRFADPVGVSGGVVEAGGGARITIPSGALSGTTALSMVNAGILSQGLPPGNWRQASPAFTIIPTNTALATNITVSLPAYGTGSDLRLWRLTGTTWSNLVGVYNPTAGMMSASTRLLGTFVVLYAAPSNAALRLYKLCEESSAAPGDDVRFALQLRNIGCTAASNVVVTDVLSTALENPAHFAPAAAYDPGSRAITWQLGTVPAETTRSLSFQARIADATPPGCSITNRASVSATGLATNSEPAVLRCGNRAEGLPRLGLADAAATNRTAIAGLGLRSRRAIADFTTLEAQSPALINWTAFDSIVRSNQAAGLLSHGVLNLHSVGGVWPQPLELAAAVAAFVERYDGDGNYDMPGLTNAIHTWELFDQYTPNSNAWVGCDLDAYAVYLLAAQAAAYDSDPLVTFANSGGEWITADNRPGYLVTLLTELPAAADGITAVAVEDFWERTDASTNTPPWRYQYLQSLDLKDLLSASPLADRPVWMTRADFRRTYADLLARGYVCTPRDLSLCLARAIPFAFGAGVAHIAYSTLQAAAGADAPTRWSALMETNGEPKEAYYVVQSLARRLEGFTSARLVNLGGDFLGVRFTTATNRPLWIAWNTGNVTGVVAVPVGPIAFARVTPAVPASWDATNATWPATTNAVINGLLALTLSGMPVYVEAIGDFDPDLDGDGIPNEADEDADGDGMPDSYEQANGLNPFRNDATEDADGDGVSNGDEYAAGTHPQDPDSVLAFSRVTLSSGAPHVQWNSAPGRIYEIRWSPDLACGWSNTLDGLIVSAGTNTSWTDSGPPKTPPMADRQHRVYRVRVVP